LKVLIVTYYWPPAGGSGVQRWLKFVKYLQDFGITPVVYTVDNPEYTLVDAELQNEIPRNLEVLKKPIQEPNKILSKLKSKQQETSAGFLNPDPSFLEKQLQYIRANYFIPDARKFWVKPSVKYLSEYLKNNKIDIVITTGPPHSLHLIGLELQKTIPVKWIADFRDPWTDIDYFHQLPLTDKSRQKHRELEHKVVQNADQVLVVGKTMKENYKQFNKNIHVITNGFDGVLLGNKSELDKKFTITHVGMMNADRNPKTLWKVLSELVQEDKRFASVLKIKLIGKVAREVKESIRKNQLEKYTEFIDYLPHNKVLDYQKSAQILLLAVNNVPASKGIITGKIFEYLQAKRPILAIAPSEGDLAEIISKTNSGVVVDFDNQDNLKNTILNFYKKYTDDELNTESIHIEQYHRKNLTRQLSDVIKNMT